MTVSGYRTDQFFGIQGAEGIGTGDHVNVNNANPPFSYPAREIITQDGTGKVTREKMQRGYIRTLINSVSGTKVAIRKCGFQFNPAVLSTSVQMTQDVRNAYQLDVGQFAVPTAGNSNFLFQLFFDRSAELNNKPLNSDILSGDTDTTNIFSGDGALSPNAIGVFRDVGELNAIIGAGLSAEQLAFANQTATNQIRAQAISEGLATASTAGAFTTSDTSVTNALANVSNVVSSVNFGNSAFLIPQPVRAVFSSLFMVEGFVTNVDINYTKFTTRMVPMQATVTLTMNAQYIGYAKKRTYVTDSLETQARVYADTQKSLQDDLNAVATALGTVAPAMSVSLSYFDSTFSIKNTAVVANAGGTVNGEGSVLTTISTATPFRVYTRIPASLDSNDNIIGGDSNALTTAVNGSSATYSGSATVSISGPYASAPTTPTSETKANLLFLERQYTSPGEWLPLARGTFPSDEHYSSVVPASYLDGSKYYIKQCSVVLTATINGNDITGTGYTGTVISDLNHATMDFTVPISWSAGVVPGQIYPVVAPANAATTPPPSGTSSPVGTRSTGGGGGRRST